jgi:adenylosuccinate synthase
MAHAKATAVIGAGWGDEGKGHVVDALVASACEAAVVVRFNGGAQAGTPS